MSGKGKENMPEPETAVRSLRARKPISYQEVLNENENDGSDYDPTEKKRNFVKKKRKNPPHSPSSSDKEDSSEEEGDDDYEQIRRRNIEERMKLVESLGIIKIKEELEKPKRANSKRKPPTPRAKSKRLKAKELGEKARLGSEEQSQSKNDLDVVPGTSLECFSASIAKETARKPSGTLPMLSLKKLTSEIKKEEHDEDDEEDDEAAAKCADFVSLLRPFLVHKGDESKLHSCSLDTFKKIISELKLTEDMVAKTNSGRITSIAFHPGEEKLLVAAGSTAGDLGLWDVYNPDEENCVEVLGPHTGQVNCTTFDKFNPSKIITTSLDGTVRRGDLMKMVFEEVWANESFGPSSHATWHDQDDPHTMLVACGNGRVVVVDSRASKKPLGWFNCHVKSVRTVQKHSKDDKFFVTASGLGQARIWDRRMMGEKEPVPVWDLVHPKGLTSAFFSCQGNLLVTTCNDDRIRVYHTAYLPGGSKPKVVTNIRHNNHTGAYVSVFKAMWHPQREDVFLIGSMDKEKKLQVFGIHGQPVFNLMSENLCTIPAVNAWHPSLPVIAGGNASGRVHVFM